MTGKYAVRFVLNIFVNVMLQGRGCLHPEVHRVGQAPTSDELHLYHPLPGHDAHHRTAGNSHTRVAGSVRFESCLGV